jgi:hypothetical protein
MATFEIEGKSYTVHPLSVIGYAEIFTKSLIDDAYAQIEILDDSAGRDLNKVRRKDAAQRRLDEAVIAHDFEPNGPQYLRALNKPHGMVMAVSVALSDVPATWRTLKPIVQKLFETDEDKFAEVLLEVGVASGFLSRANELVESNDSTSDPPKT